MNIQLKYKINSNRVNIACIVHIVLLLLNRQSDEQPFGLEQFSAATQFRLRLSLP